MPFMGKTVMAITSILQSNAAVGATGNPVQGGGSQQDQNPLAALQRKAESASTRLSVFGQVQLSLDDLQAKAQAVRTLGNPPTLSDFKLAVQGVVQSFNSLSKTVSAAAAARASNQAAAAATLDPRPAQALNEVRQAVAGSNGNALRALQEIGITRRQDGTFEINEKQLDKAFLENRERTVATFGETSSRIDEVAARQLSGNGVVGQRLSNLSEQQATRGEAQARFDSQRSFQQQLAAQLARAGSFVARNAVATYLTVAAL